MPPETNNETHALLEKHQLQRVCQASHFIQAVYQKQTDAFIALSQTLETPRLASFYTDELNTFTSDPLPAYKKSIRLFRSRELARIAWRSFCQFASVEQSLLELSALADALILSALRFAEKDITHSEILDKNGVPQQLAVVLLGKLGGQELNFSSDIDIYFAYKQDGDVVLDGKEIRASQLFSKIAQKTVSLLADVTQDGFVYRVDLRLRPYGQSGPLVMSLSELETYYQEQGRDWERYSLMKARVLELSPQLAAELQQIITPFVYRRYIDFSVLESLRSLKVLMEREVQLKNRAGDIKRGPGGIREIEFFTQSMQLIHGGREQCLQSQSLLTALNELCKQQLISATVKSGMLNAYLYLRKLENAIQALDDKQTHDLPTREESIESLCLLLQVETFDEINVTLNHHRAYVSKQFAQILKDEGESESDNERLLLQQLKAIWQGQLGDIPSEDALTALGFQSPVDALERLRDFANSPKCKRLSQVARLRLDNFVPLMLIKVAKQDNVDELLTRILRLIEGIAKRSAYLALLIENPHALDHLLRLFARSHMVAKWVSEQPFLLEILLNEEALFKSLTEEALADELNQKIVNQHGLDEVSEALRQFKHANSLSIAAKQVLKSTSPFAVSDELTNVASLVVRELLDKVCEDKKDLLNHFAVIAYGRLGAGELSYHSDLDLVFLHNCDSHMQPKILRLAQRLLNLLQSRMIGGQLYTVDARLRPSGNAGLLVCHIDAFTDYQMNQAWTFEHQALVKARGIAGDKTLLKQFQTVREKALSKQRETATLIDDVQAMIKKMRKEKSAKSEDVKLTVGGLVDIEFLVQCCVLKFSSEHPSILEQTATQRLIECLGEECILTVEQTELLARCYRKQLNYLHWHALRDDLPHQLPQELLLTDDELNLLWQQVQQ